MLHGLVPVDIDRDSSRSRNIEAKAPVPPYNELFFATGDQNDAPSAVPCLLRRASRSSSKSAVRLSRSRQAVGMTEGHAQIAQGGQQQAGDGRDEDHQRGPVDAGIAESGDAVPEHAAGYDRGGHRGGSEEYVPSREPALNAFAITFGDRFPAAETY